MHSCGAKTYITKNSSDKGNKVAILYCDNKKCKSRILSQFEHFVSKKAMNIEGLSRATIEKLYDANIVNTFKDLYHINEYEDVIVEMDGFGERSYERIWSAIEDSRKTYLTNFIVSLDIPMVGKTASEIISKSVSGKINLFSLAIANPEHDFKTLDGIGEVIEKNIKDWFSSEENMNMSVELAKELEFYHAIKMEILKNTVFAGKTIVVTGKLNKYTRSSIEKTIKDLGAFVGSSVTKNTNYLIIGEKPGAKLDKAKVLGVEVISEGAFIENAML